jgi:hypothetical protein
VVARAKHCGQGEITLMRPVAFGEPLPVGTRLTLFSDDKPNRFFTVIKFWIDETSGVALELKIGVPTYQVEDEEGRTHLLLHLPIEENGDRWRLWRPDQVAFDSRSISKARWLKNRRTSNCRIGETATSYTRNHVALENNADNGVNLSYGIQSTGYSTGRRSNAQMVVVASWLA